MKKLNLSKRRGLGGKGFYIALVVSVAAVGTAVYLTVSQWNRSLEIPPVSDPGSTLDWSLPEVSQTNKPESNVPKDVSSKPVDESSQSAEPSQPAKSDGGSSAPVEETPAPQITTGAYIMPLAGEILNPFSNGELVKSKTLNEWRTHDGIDIKASIGTPVKSIYDGTVKDIREDKKWGVTIEVEYPDCTAIYMNLSDNVSVKKGQEVKLGDVIGEVGNTAIIESAEEPHLHLAIRKDGGWVDPMNILTKN
jgi:murein DD-endopeptidase MepM/ murein hydrolase activator NlpD